MLKTALDKYIDTNPPNLDKVLLLYTNILLTKKNLREKEKELLLLQLKFNSQISELKELIK